MGIPRATYPSKSSPGKIYTVSSPNGGGEEYCDCWQWKRNRDCSHLRAYLKNGATKAVNKKPAVMTGEGEEDVDNVIDNVINNFFPKKG
jgi:hypothetical protein